MWCPNCKNEYRPGITECADCHVPLVEELTEEMLAKAPEVEGIDPDFVDWANKHPEAIAQMQREHERFTMLEAEQERLAVEDEELDVNEIVDSVIPEPAAIFQSKSKRAQEYQSSGLTLLGVGGAGLVLLILVLLGIIPLNLAENIRFLSYGVMGAMFVIFIFVGIYSLKASKKLAQEGKEEDAQLEGMMNWFRESFSADEIDADAFSGDIDILEDIDKYYKRVENIKKKISAQYPSFDEAILDRFSDTLFHELYEDDGAAE